MTIHDQIKRVLTKRLCNHLYKPNGIMEEAKTHLRDRDLWHLVFFDYLLWDPT